MFGSVIAVHFNSTFKLPDLKPVAK